MENNTSPKPTRPIMDVTARRPIQPVTRSGPVAPRVNSDRIGQPAPAVDQPATPRQEIVKPQASETVVPHPVEDGAAEDAHLDQLIKDTAAANDSSESNKTRANSQMPPRPQLPWLAIILALITSAILIGVAVTVYLRTKDSNPAQFDVSTISDPTIDRSTQAIDDALDAINPSVDQDPLGERHLSDETLEL